MPKKKPPKKVPTVGRTSAGSKKTTPRQRAAKRPPPAPKSGARPARPAVLDAGRQALALPGLPQPDPGQAINLGPIAGTGSPTGALGAGAVDLCEISPGGQVALGGDQITCGVQNVIVACMLVRGFRQNHGDDTAQRRGFVLDPQRSWTL